ncbi:MAG: TolC family protein [Candidatus Kuenenia sp.]|nr:TolC family protein [Candidatus Kuenenia hertensis]
MFISFIYHEIGLNESQNLVSITQPIITAGKRGLEIKVSKKAKEKSEFERDSFLLSVIADTKKAFYKVLADQEGYTVAKETEKISKDIYESEKLRFESGEVALTNVLRAEVELSKARNRVSLMDGKLQNSFKELQTIMGIPEVNDLNITGKLITAPMELSLDELELNMKNNQPMLKASEKKIEIAVAQLMLEQRQVIPNISVSAGYKRLSQEDADTVQFGLGIPALFFTVIREIYKRARPFPERQRTKALQCISKCCSS